MRNFDIEIIIPYPLPGYNGTCTVKIISTTQNKIISKIKIIKKKKGFVKIQNCKV